MCVCVRAEELTTTATMKMAAARTPAAKYALCNSMGLLSTTDEPKVLSLKFLAFTSSTINSLELTTVSTTNSSAHSEANMQRENECKWLVPAGMTLARGRPRGSRRNRSSRRRIRRSRMSRRKKQQKQQETGLSCHCSSVCSSCCPCGSNAYFSGYPSSQLMSTEART